MIWAFEVLSSLCCGHEIVTALVDNDFDPIQRIFAGAPIGFFLFAWLCFIFSYKKELNFQVAIPSLIIQITLTILLHFHTNKRIHLKTKTCLFPDPIRVSAMQPLKL